MPPSAPRTIKSDAPAPVADAILALLSESSRPCSSTELRTRLRLRGHRLAEYEITGQLRQLRSVGSVRLTRRHWEIADHRAAPTADRSAPEPTGSRGISHEGASTWAPSGSWIFGPASGDGSGTSPDEGSDTTPDDSPWGKFRQLLDYYSDCVRNDEGCEASSNMGDIGRRFVPIQPIGTWYPAPGRKWTMTLPAAGGIDGLIRTLAGSGDAGVLVVGYPLWIYTGPEKTDESDSFLKPIFTYSVDYEIHGSGITISSEDPIADVNLDWLSYALKQPERQRVFLTAAGLMDRGGELGDFDEGAGCGPPPDLATLGTAVTTFFGAQVREPLSPGSLSALHQGARPMTGIYNHAVLMAANRTRYAQSLLKDLARIRNAPDEELDKTALSRVFRIGPSEPATTGSSESLEESPPSALVADTCDLNGEQREAVRSLLSQETTVVTGPPGTGKSQVVASAIANARIQGQSVLFASRNHKAIDAVLSRPEMITEDGMPLIVRANDRESGISFGFADAIKELLTAPYDETAEGTAEALRSQLVEYLEDRASQESVAEEIIVLRDEIAKIETALAQLAAEWSEECLNELDHAPKRFPADLALKLSMATRSLSSLEPPTGWFSKLRTRFKTRTARRLAGSVERRLRKGFTAWSSDRSRYGIDELGILAERAESLRSASEYAKARIRLRPLETRAAELPPASDVTDRVQALTDQIVEIISEVIEQDSLRRVGLRQDADRAGLASLQVGLRKLYDALSTDEIRRQSWAALKSHLPELLAHYPAWAVTNLSIGSRIPLMSGIFDLAVIDEASQCDIPSAIPILFRARRAAVVGDPLQLSHSTKLTRARENVICKRRGITSLREQRFSYRDTSLFDVLAQTNSVKPVLLRDHYRCATEIAEYANSTFYGSSLRVVTAADRLRVPPRTKPGIHWTPIASPLTPARTGCTAAGEVDEIARLLRLLVVEQDFGGTVGVVTPFQAQKQQLRDKVFSDPDIAAAAARVKLIVDTAHGFQGDERDVMYMSLCAGPGMPAKSLGWLKNTANLLNVAATRARAVLHVVGNQEWAARCDIRHIARLARPPSSGGSMLSARGERFESIWERRLYDAMALEGLEPIVQHPLLGRRLDLALIREGKVPIDIEVDGARFHREPDGSRRRDDIWRDITIRGAGWKVMRFWAHELRDDMSECVRRIRRECDNVT